MKKIIGLIVVVVWCSFFGLTSAAGTDGEYMMRSGDQLQITVYGHPDLSTPLTSNLNPYVVRPDGRISFPLIGDLDVQGKTVRVFVEELTNRFSEYLVKPQIAVNIMKLGTTRVYVLGEVKKPGLYELEKSHNVLDAVGIAEGFTDKAAKKRIFLIRKGEKEPIKVNLNRLLTKGDITQNYTLNEGDCLYLTSNGKINFARDIIPLISGVYMVSEIKNN